MPRVNLGKVRLVPRGDYVSTETYNYLDIVNITGSTFMCNVEGTVGIDPETDTSGTWTALLKRNDSQQTALDVETTQANVDITNENARTTQADAAKTHDHLEITYINRAICDAAVSTNLIILGA